MSAPVDVLEMLDAYRNVPCTWGRNHDKDEITEARDAVAELIGATDNAILVLTQPSAPTKTERDEVVSLLLDALDRVGGEK